MQVYFACAITGGRQDERVYQAIVAALEQAGHQVPTAHLTHPEGLAAEAQAHPTAVYERDTAWIRESDALIAEVSTPSHGVGYEIAYALQHGKPVLLLFREDVRVSKMLLGNPHPNLHHRAYRTPEEAGALAAAFLQNLMAQQAAADEGAALP